MLLGVTAVAVALAISPALVSAQGNTPCFGLGTDDCALLTASHNPPKGALSSFVMDLQVNSKSSGTGGNPMSTTIHVTGPFATTADMSSMMPGPGAMFGGGTGMAGMFQNLGSLTLDDTVDAAGVGRKGPYQDHAEIRLINGILYLNDTMNTKGSWKMLDLKAMGAFFAGMAAGGLRRPGGAGGLGGAGTPVAPPAVPTQDPAQVAAHAQALLNTPGMIKATRGPDMNIDNQTIAVFVMTLDLPTLFNSPDFLWFAQARMARQAPGTALSDDQIKAKLAQAADALKGLQISWSRYVGTTDKLPHGGTLDVTGTINTAELASARLTPNGIPGAGMFGGGLLGGRGAGGFGGLGTPQATASGPTTVDSHIKITLSGIGQPVTVQPPTGATPFKFGFGAGAGGLGGLGTGTGS